MLATFTFSDQMVVSMRHSFSGDVMIPPIDDVKNWMHLFRWIVKLIRDRYEVDEAKLVRNAVLETDCGLAIEDVETVMRITAEAFRIRFPPGTLDEVLRLEELCLLASWLGGFYKRPDFLSEGFSENCRGLNPHAGDARAKQANIAS